MLSSMAKAEQARGALAGGRYEEAISLYQEAIKLFLSEPDDEQPICEECGNREHYWPHIWTGSIQAIEVFLAGATAQMTTPTSKAFAVATYTSQVL